MKLSRQPHASPDGEYTAAWDKWVDSGEVEAWEPTVGDGLADAAR